MQNFIRLYMPSVYMIFAVKPAKGFIKSYFASKFLKMGYFTGFKCISCSITGFVCETQEPH